MAHWYVDTARLDFGWGLPWERLGTACAALATLISTVHVYHHWKLPGGGRAKQCTLRILAVVPLFSLDAALCLNLHRTFSIPIVLTGIRDFYESVVLVSFVQLLLAYLGRADQGRWRNNRTPAEKLADMLSMQTPRHPAPFRCVPVPYLPGLDFVAWVLAGTLQYAVVMNLVLLLDLLVWAGRVFTTGHDDLLTKLLGAADGMKAASAGFALYNLGLLYLEAKRCEKTKKQLHQIHPENKFLCVKLIVFFTFWQKMCCTFLQNRNWLPQAADWTPAEVAGGIQNFLLCVEMLIFAVWHRYAYPVGEFNQVAARAALTQALQKNTAGALRAALDEASEAGLEERVFEVAGRSLTVHGGELRLAFAKEDGSRLSIVDEGRAEVTGFIRLEEALVVEAREQLKQLDEDEDDPESPSGWSRACTPKSDVGTSSISFGRAHTTRPPLEPLKWSDLFFDVKDIWSLASRYRKAASLLRHPKVWAVYRLLETNCCSEGGVVHEEKIRRAFEMAGGSSADGSSADGARARAQDVSRAFAKLGYRPFPQMEEMLERKRDEKDSTVSCEDLLNMFKTEEEAALGLAFDELDVKKDGSVKEWELKATLKKVGVTASKKMLSDFFEGKGLNHSLTLEEFIKWYRKPRDSQVTGSERERVVANHSGLTHNGLREAFDTFDLDQNGYITREEFAHMLLSTQEATEQNVDALFDQLDTDQNDQIDFPEFERACHFIMPAQGRQMSWTDSAALAESNTTLGGGRRSVVGARGGRAPEVSARTPLLQAEEGAASTSLSLRLPGSCTPERGEPAQQGSPAQRPGGGSQAARAGQLLRALQLRQRSAEEQLRHVAELHRARRTVEDGDAGGQGALLPCHAEGPPPFSTSSRLGAPARGNRPFATRPW